MSFFEFPHTRTYDSDLGWLIWAMKKLIGDMTEFTEINSIKFGDPINWNIATQYEPTTIVVDDEGNGYISRKAVPAGIALTDTEYWTRIFNFSDITDTIRDSIAVNAGNSATTPVALKDGDLVWWNGNIYRVQYDIAAGTAFIDGTNVVPYTVNDRIQEVGADIGSIEQAIADETSARESADQALHDAIDAETAARESADADLESKIKKSGKPPYQSIKNSNGAISNLVDIATTYYKESSNLVYGNFNGAFNTNCVKVGGRWEIDCSTFVQLCLMGIPFQNSRYNGNVYNIPIESYPYKFDELIIDPDVDRPYGMLANGIAKYADDHGFLYEINHDIDNIEIGDILFLSQSPYPEYYLSVSHCSIVIGKNKYNGWITCIGVNTTNPLQPCIIERYDINADYVLHAARFPLTDCGQIANNMLNNGLNPAKNVTVSIPAGNSTFEVSKILFNDALEVGEFYTIAVKTSPLPDNMHFNLYGTIGGNLGVLDAAFGGITKDTMHFTSFIVPLNYSNSDLQNAMHYISLRIVLDIVQSVPISENVRIESVALYKGIIVPQYIEQRLQSLDNVKNNNPMTTPTAFTNQSELYNHLQSLRSGMSNWTTKQSLIQLSNTINGIQGGRYLVITTSYNNGLYGSHLLIAISGNALCYILGVLDNNITIAPLH